VEAVGIFPDSAPYWVQDTAQCWGRLDAAAMRCHTQLRGFHICADLPEHEPPATWAWTAHDLLKLVEPKGVHLVADLCIHVSPKRRSHAHILLAGRVLEENGFGGVLPGMDQILSDISEQWHHWLGFNVPPASYPPDPYRTCRTCRRQNSPASLEARNNEAANGLRLSNWSFSGQKVSAT
jgi:hypothetical protein